MIIDHNKILEHIRKGPPVSGAIHVGASQSEELPFYRDNFGDRIPICWIEADPRREPELRNALLSDDKSWYLIQAIADRIGLRTFYRASNWQSSSLLEFGTHKDVHPEVIYVGHLAVMTMTLDDIDFSPEYNFLNMDVQGAEGLVLQGAEATLKHVDYIYTEVNRDELYKGCMLLPDMDNFLINKGFERRVMNMQGYGWGDAFYVRVTK